MTPRVPSPRQWHWHANPFYGFVHFGMNTFTDREWGYGDEDPALFNPSALDCRQWARAARDVGMTRLILTAKHHDGFCLWPSRWTDHSVKNSPWKDGKGDVVREFVDACASEGIEAGLYLSPWDRNHKDYGRPEYVEYYHRQLEELLGGAYGTFRQVWLDGANGGDGWYGGARESRQIDRSTYYDFPRIVDTIRRLQPEAVIFSDAGPDIRWIGNESGASGSTCWGTMDPAQIVVGDCDTKYLAAGDAQGTHWIPPEVDVSIRPGWFWHSYEAPHSVQRLVSIWFSSIGHGHGLNLNVPPDRRGLFAEEDILQLQALRNAVQANCHKDLALAAETRQIPGQLPARDIVLPARTRVNCIHLEEAVADGQKIASFEVDVCHEGDWTTVARGGTVGVRMMVPFDSTFADVVRVRVTAAVDCPVALSRISLYHAPNLP